MFWLSISCLELAGNGRLQAWRWAGSTAGPPGQRIVHGSVSSYCIGYSLYKGARFGAQIGYLTAGYESEPLVWNARFHCIGCVMEHSQPVALGKICLMIECASQKENMHL